MKYWQEGSKIVNEYGTVAIVMTSDEAKKIIAIIDESEMEKARYWAIVEDWFKFSMSLIAVMVKMEWSKHDYLRLFAQCTEHGGTFRLGPIQLTVMGPPDHERNGRYIVRELKEHGSKFKITKGFE